jgi:protein involved in polysaccharide export with SLBB domain
VRKLAFLAACAALVLPLGAHAGQAGDEAILARLPVDQAWSPDDYKYTLSPGDELGVRFLLSPDLNAQVTVGPDGRAVFPLIASVPVAGLTIEQADAALAQAYSGYLRKPVVELLVYNYVGGQIYVAGEVKNPGARPIHGQVSITQAIGDVGGFVDTAKVDRVILLRRRPNGRVLLRLVDVKAILAGRAPDDVLLLPGDVIYVPRSTIAEVDRIVRQYITGVLPFTPVYQLNGTGGSVIP